MKRLLVLTVSMFSAVVIQQFLASGAWAQEDESERDDRVLDELVVTAQRRSGNLQEVPVAAPVASTYE